MAAKLKKIVTTTDLQQRNVPAGGEVLSLYWHSGNFSKGSGTYDNLTPAGVADYKARYTKSGAHDLICLDREKMFKTGETASIGGNFPTESIAADMVTAALVTALQTTMPSKPVHVYTGTWLGNIPDMGHGQYANPSREQRFEMISRAQSQCLYIDKTKNVDLGLEIGTDSDEEIRKIHIQCIRAQAELADLVCPKAEKLMWIKEFFTVGGQNKRIPEDRCRFWLDQCAPFVDGFILFANGKSVLESPMFKTLQTFPDYK